MPNKGNILLVANWESDVGYAWWLMENFWATISEHFGKQQIRSYLIYPKVNQLPESIANSEIEVYKCDFRDHSLPNLKKLHHLIKSHNLRFLYLSDSPSYSVFYLLLRIWGIKVIVIHDHTPGDRTPARSWRKFLKSLIQRIPFFTADHFIAVTDFVYRRFIDVACIPPQKCSVAPNGIVPVELSNADIRYAQKTFNIPDDRTIVVTTGRASRYKGIDFVIECANELIHRRNTSRLHFLFCGDGPNLEDFRRLAAERQLNDRFTFASRRSDIVSILPSCDIGMQASKGEVGYSLSILEYMSAGLATIVPDLPSTSEATVHGNTGLVYRHLNIRSACDVIEQCLTTTVRKQLGDNAIAMVRKSYTLDNTNQQLVRILGRLFQ